MLNLNFNGVTTGELMKKKKQKEFDVTQKTNQLLLIRTYGREWCRWNASFVRISPADRGYGLTRKKMPMINISQVAEVS